MSRMIVEQVVLDGIKGKEEYLMELSENNSVYVLYNIDGYLRKLYGENRISKCPEYGFCWRIRPLSEWIKGKDTCQLQNFINRVLYSGTESIVRIVWR